MRPRKSSFPNVGTYGIERSGGNVTIVKSLQDSQGDIISVLILYSNYYEVSTTGTRRWYIGSTKGISKKEIAAMGITLND